MANTTNAEITMEEALALCVKKWGPGSSVSILDMGGPDVTPFERDRARLDLAEHAKLEPKLPPGRDDITMGQHRTERERWYGAHDEWSKRNTALHLVAYRYRYRVESPNQMAVSSRNGRRGFDRNSPHYASAGEGFSWSEALANAKVIG